MIRSTALALLLLAAPVWSAAALELTPAQTEGPFYPRRKPADTDADLTRIGSGAVAKGEVLVLDVRVVDPYGKPIEGARVEIWQVDHQGIYLHPDDPNHRRRDPLFQGYGEARSDAEGGVRFTTIRPPSCSLGRLCRPWIGPSTRPRPDWPKGPISWPTQPTASPTSFCWAQAAKSLFASRLMKN